MNGITFTVELLQPMLATGLEGDPNSGVSLPYIAGSVVRGAVIGLFLQRNSQRDLAVAERDLFFNDRVRFLNAYPLVEVSNADLPKRSLPTPLSWHKQKDGKEVCGGEDADSNIHDFAKTDAKKVDPNSDRQFKGLNARFFAFTDATSSYVVKAELKKRISVHTRRNPTKGRATDEDGDVFRYESIETGTKFGGVIISDDLSLLRQVKTLIEDKTISVGGSRTGGYGRAQIQTVVEKADWWETDRKSVLETATNEIQIGEPFTITLLSNALIRDGNGQLQSELSAAALGLTNAEIEPQKDLTHIKAELIGGFNRKWGLPLPQQISIKAGSVLTFKANRKIERIEIVEWLNKGIGERLVDGFGRIAVNLHLHSALSFAEANKKELSSVALASTFGLKAGQVIVNRIAKQRMQSQLVGLVGEYTISRSPKKSQISRLRLFTQEILSSEGTSTKEAQAKFRKDFFGQIRETAREQFHRARIEHSQNQDKGNLETWICDYVLGDPDLFASQHIALGKSGGEVTSADNHLNLQFRLRLIDGVLEKAAKESRQ